MKASNVFGYIDGIPDRQENDYFQLSIDGEDLVLEQITLAAFSLSNWQSLRKYRVPLENIIDAGIVNGHETVEKEKSAFARGAVGGLLFGSAGMFLGAVSGSGTKKVTKWRSKMVILYLSESAPNSPRCIMLDVNAFNKSPENYEFEEKLKKNLGWIEPSEAVLALRGQMCHRENEDGSITL